MFGPPGTRAMFALPPPEFPDEEGLSVALQPTSSTAVVAIAAILRPGCLTPRDMTGINIEPPGDDTVIIACMNCASNTEYNILVREATGIEGSFWMKYLGKTVLRRLIPICYVVDL